MAHLVVRRGEFFGLQPVVINVEDKEVNQRAGLDISRIFADTGWEPQIGITDMIDALYIMKLSQSK